MASALVPSRLQTQHNGSTRLARVLLPLFAALARIPVSYAAPLLQLAKEKGDGEPDAKPADDPSLWLYLGTAVGLVVMGGIFAGLTIAYVFLLPPTYALEDEGLCANECGVASWAKTRYTSKSWQPQAMALRNEMLPKCLIC